MHRCTTETHGVRLCNCVSWSSCCHAYKYPDCSNMTSGTNVSELIRRSTSPVTTCAPEWGSRNGFYISLLVLPVRSNEKLSILSYSLALSVWYACVALLVIQIWTSMETSFFLYCYQIVIATHYLDYFTSVSSAPV